MSTGAKTKMRKQAWSVGSVFSVEQPDGFCSVGQVLDLMLPNAPSCAFYDLRFKSDTPPSSLELTHEKIIAVVSTTREQLDRGVWRILGMQPVSLAPEFWPNESLRASGWVGAVTHGAGIITRFLEAFYGLSPWDYYADPNYFDALLIDRSKKPKNLIFKKR